MYARSAFGPREEPIESTTETISPDMVSRCCGSEATLRKPEEIATSSKNNCVDMVAYYDYLIPGTAEKFNTCLDNNLLSNFIYVFYPYLPNVYPYPYSLTDIRGYIRYPCIRADLYSTIYSQILSSTNNIRYSPNIRM
ncbi:hypothetical protein LIPSTDRAFT_330091 [Lipomyces starkeyi NRRL Y-11557]|uniref:Uncharacterized protein n=1 Tax=Lipomyces starkeyi NRRL Y-11557 TaxID=675824 RepID=A0A1E3Q2K3_LIPST|nr:hypothetical protein LIPSTDRAFT_330091 [Lipomyces starkeyi NRRL Y-11557]